MYITDDSVNEGSCLSWTLASSSSFGRVTIIFYLLVSLTIRSAPYKGRGSTTTTLSLDHIGVRLRVRLLPIFISHGHLQYL
jgi:hypothetical protein